MFAILSSPVAVQSGSVVLVIFMLPAVLAALNVDDAVSGRTKAGVIPMLHMVCGSTNIMRQCSAKG